MSDPATHPAPACSPRADGSAPICCALASDETGLRDCGAPATHRSHSGRPYCPKHAEQRLDLGSTCYPIQLDRPDPRGVRLLLRVFQYELAPSRVLRLMRERSVALWEFLVEFAESAFKTIVGLLMIPIGIVWWILAIPYQLAWTLFWAVTKPDKAREACRILDGLPPNAPHSATEGRP